jgi:hypothetical protein
MEMPEVLHQQFFAFEDALMLEHVEDAIEITEQQYNDAIAAKMAGRKTFVRDGELVIFSGVMVKAWGKETRQAKEFDEFDLIPDEYTTIEPVGDVVWGGDKWAERVKTEQELAWIDHDWVMSELKNVDLQISLHLTDDRRATHTLEAWKKYARDLRDYTSEDNGVVTVNSEVRPSIGQ